MQCVGCCKIIVLHDKRANCCQKLTKLLSCNWHFAIANTQHNVLHSQLNSAYNKLENLHVILLWKKGPHGVGVCGMLHDT